MPPLFALLADLPLLEGLGPVDVARRSSGGRSRGAEEIPRGAAGPNRPLTLMRGAVRLMRGGPDGRMLGVGLLAEGGVFGRLPFSAAAPEERAEALDESRILSIA